MFTAERWAEAFINVLEEGAAGDGSGGGGDRPEDAGDHGPGDRGLAVLKALAGPVGLIPGEKGGSAAAAQLDRMIQRAFAQASAQCGPAGKEGETARGFLLLIIKRNAFQHIDLIIKETEKLLDRKKHILRVTVESALPMDDGFWESLREPLMRKTGAGDIRFITRTVPELLSGYRILAGGEFFDASLRGQLQKMAEDLALPPGGF
jgi:F0F1-type ATP synthase delta subunit